MSTAGDMPLNKPLKGVDIDLSLFKGGHERHHGTFENHRFSPARSIGRLLCVFNILCLLFFALPAAAIEVPDVQGAIASLQSNDDPVAEKLRFWLIVTETKQPVSTQALMNFTLANPNWPKLYIFRDAVEKDADFTHLGASKIAPWFDQKPPKTARGITAYVSALTALGYTDKARTALRNFWLEADLNKKETENLAKTYRTLFPPGAQEERLENLLWNFRYAEAEYMLPLASADKQHLAKAVIALGRASSKAPKLVEAVPSTLQHDPLLLYMRLKWRRQMNKDNDALAMLRLMPKNPPHPELWWRERSIMARRALEKQNYAGAYAILQSHGLKEGGDYAQAEWQMGWLALRFLHRPEAAYKHFDDFYKSVTSAVSRARGAYWIARATEAMGKEDIAQTWYRYGAQFASTFYGQICHEKLYGDINADQLTDDDVSASIQEAFDAQESVQAIRLMAKLKLNRYADTFFIKLLDKAKDKSDYQMIAALGRETNRLYFAVEANKQAQQKLGAFLFDEGYPKLSSVPVDKPERALIHAIVHRESMFDPRAESPAGAKGLMQLMPATAKQVSKRAGKRYSAERLTDEPLYNVELGSRYLQSLIDAYNGYYPLAIAAYNAGPYNVDGWIRQFGDPRRSGLDVLDWVELIPIYETRNYVQRVMESYYLYKLKFSEKPRTVMDFK